ncbi:MAG TPA: nitroreductase/quinone reductase family protein [Trebonia sp.]|nr:nitroreductase/quinone reductase family protein [Trebonia sp.]
MTRQNAPAPRPQGQAKLMPAQKAANRVMQVLLRTPGISSGMGRRLMIINVAGRKTGKRYSVPVAYTRHEGALLVGTSFAWARNMRTGEPVEVILQGRRRQADVQVITDPDGVVAAYDVICRDNHQFARFNNIRLDAEGAPVPADVQAAYGRGARAYRLSPR